MAESAIRTTKGCRLNNIKGIADRLRDLKVYWIAHPKDVFWIFIIAGVFFLFTYWIFDLPGVIILVVLFGAKVGWDHWHVVETILKYHSQIAPLTLATEDTYPALMGTIRRACLAAGIPMIPVYIWHVPYPPNACAFGRSKGKSAIVVYETLQTLLTPTELKGVISHEIAHIVNGDSINDAICNVFCKAIETEARIFTWLGSTILGVLLVPQNSRKKEEINILVFLLILAIGLPLLFLGLVAHVLSFVAHLVLKNISRTRELRADITGAKIARDPQSIGDGLLKLETWRPLGSADSLPLKVRRIQIVNPLTELGPNDSFLGRLLGDLQSTHPATEERVRRLNVFLANQQRNQKQ